MDRLGVGDPQVVAVVGDTVSDLQAGNAAGAGMVVGVLSGAHDAATLEAASPTAVLADVTGLIALLGQA
jgi:phosphoglycolate phosphatase-like HAD superfamily hydrolase